MSEWVRWVSKWVHQWVTDWVSMWMSEWVNKWVYEWVCEWVSEWASDWASEWVSRWVRQSGNHIVNRSDYLIMINNFTIINNFKMLLSCSTHNTLKLWSIIDYASYEVILTYIINVTWSNDIILSCWLYIAEMPLVNWWSLCKSFFLICSIRI